MWKYKKHYSLELQKYLGSKQWKMNVNAIINASLTLTNTLPHPLCCPWSCSQSKTPFWGCFSYLVKYKVYKKNQQFILKSYYLSRLLFLYLDMKVAIKINQVCPKYETKVILLLSLQMQEVLRKWAYLKISLNKACNHKSNQMACFLPIKFTLITSLSVPLPDH